MNETPAETLLNSKYYAHDDCKTTNDKYSGMDNYELWEYLHNVLKYFLPWYNHYLPLFILPLWDHDNFVYGIYSLILTSFNSLS